MWVVIGGAVRCRRMSGEALSLMSGRGLPRLDLDFLAFNMRAQASAGDESDGLVCEDIANRWCLCV
jgi:hypothetical protein